MAITKVKFWLMDTVEAELWVMDIHKADGYFPRCAIKIRHNFTARLLSSCFLAFLLLFISWEKTSKQAGIAQMVWWKRPRRCQESSQECLYQSRAQKTTSDANLWLELRLQGRTVSQAQGCFKLRISCFELKEWLRELALFSLLEKASVRDSLKAITWRWRKIVFYHFRGSDPVVGFSR